MKPLEELELMKAMKDWGYNDDYILNILVEIEKGYGLGKSMILAIETTKRDRERE